MIVHELLRDRRVRPVSATVSPDLARATDSIRSMNVDFEAHAEN